MTQFKVTETKYAKSALDPPKNKQKETRKKEVNKQRPTSRRNNHVNKIIKN
jgi:hypothetical protein